jgi:cell pole-organizing protein PopZ
MAALSQLSTLSAQRPQISDMPLGDANRTLLDLVRELLRPMLKDWLDTNLPPLVERLVQEEIRRVSREILTR